ncbi:unnamed protein product [Eruca vesicaria subsp. sativa]|uniref:Uncharacterized protein n=1 Tax=Eruca vesicaria subsp. sativa TaxID=29727 RepID=A0ABC8LRF2_ERUVS|nr:unnamed protein product [Eruca vesicaria subsp. sativa]
MDSLVLLQPLHSLTSTIFFSQQRSCGLSHFTSSLKRLPLKRLNLSKPSTLTFALAESDSPQPLETSPKSLLQQLSKCFDLPSDYFRQLPSDLRLDLNDAAFDLSNGPIIDEPLGGVWYLREKDSRAWDSMVKVNYRRTNVAENSQIAKAMITTGEVLSANTSPASVGNESMSNTRMFKFGELQVAVSPEKAYAGAAIAFVFGILSWQISQGIQSTPENSLQYANENALLLAKSLRGSLLAMFYASAVLSGFTTAGLLLLAKQLSSEKDS